MLNLLASKFAQIATAIDNTTAQITTLQVKLSELQEHQQQLQSVEQACQSALSQVDTALMMLNHVDPTEINTFKDAINIKFNSETIALISPTAPDTAPNTAPDTAPNTAPDTAPNTASDTTPLDDESVIDVTPDIDTATDTAPDTDIEKTLATLSLQSFRKLAKSKGLDSRLNRTVLTVRLKALVTRGEVLAVS